MDSEKILVSVLCCTYNQKIYIEQTIRSLVMQETSFAYEVLVHDDASTDGTADIVRRLAAEYPDKIRAVCQTVNQYSQGILPHDNLYPLVRGKYLAICEGDDYWTSKEKLEKQVRALEAHPECDMCAHEAILVEAKSQRIIGRIAPLAQDGILTMAQVISGGGNYMATNSLMVRRELMEQPTSYEKLAPFDYCMQMHGAARGGIVYLAEAMSAYRRGAKNSWTLAMQKNPAKQIAHYELMKEVLDLVNQETKGEYQSITEVEKKKYDFEIAVTKRDGAVVFGKEMKKIRSDISQKRKFILFLMCYMPWLFDLLFKLKNR